jgi:hypothetical protein
MKALIEILFTCSIIMILMSCSTKEKSGFLTIPVPDESAPLKLSEITNGIEAIEIEVTDQSLIGGRPAIRVLCSEDYIIVCERRSIMQFDGTGKFIRKIAAVGQGPGEFTTISDITADNENRKLFIKTNTGKIMCYDFENNFIRESPHEHYEELTKCLNYINNELLYLSESVITSEGERKNQAVLYTINNDLLKTDNITVQTIRYNGSWNSFSTDFITTDGENTYVYYSDLTTNPFVLDTLYQIKDKQLEPHLNLSFKNNGMMSSNIEKEIYLFNIYRSSRYVFANYNNETKNPKDTYDKFSSFCYDIKAGKGYNMQGGYLDDVHTGKNVKIRPFNDNSNKFYYLVTNMDENTFEEPNPTLYIGTLKE